MNPEIAIETLLREQHATGILPPCVVAVSGGMDSTVLLVAAKNAGVPIIAAHINYGLRKAESDDNQLFCEQLCASFNIPLYISKLSQQQTEELESGNVQIAAREIRYRYLEEVRRENGCEFILTAHHFDDQVETVIYRLLRGSGLKTLYGIRAQNKRVLRPFLHLKKDELLTYAAQQELSWSTDSSNSSNDYDRNKIRNRLLPLLYELIPHQDNGIKRSLQVINTESEIINEWLITKEREWIVKEDEKYYLQEACLQAGEKGEYFLCHFLAPFGFSSAQSKLIPMLLTAENNKAVSNSNYRIIRRNNQFVLEPKVRKLQNRLIITDLVPIDSVDLTDKNSGWMDANKIEGDLYVGYCSEGCRMEPLGLRGSKLVSDILNEMKIPQDRRSDYPLLFDNLGVVWIPGYRIADRVKIVEGVTTTVIRAFQT